jgi:hypothetical protein
MIAVAATFLVLAAWEWPNLARWPWGERMGFWVCWGLALGWAVAVQRHYPLPTGPALIQAVFRDLARRFMTARPDIFW